jgi:hypothetical protein
MLSGHDSCYLSHNCPFAEVTSLAMASHPQFCLQASMLSNNKSFHVKFVRRMHFGVQTRTKPLTPQLAPLQDYETSGKATQS